MILALYGPDTYRSRKKLNEIITEYRKKAGSNLNMHRLDAEEDDIRILKSLCETQSLFSSKKLIVVENAFSSGSNPDFLKDTLLSVKDSQDVVVLLWEGELGAAAKKELPKIGKNASKIQEFKILQGEDLNRWIRFEARERNLALSPSEAAHLVSYGGDLWKITNELEKMMLGSPLRGGEEVWGDPTIFQLGDSFFTSKRGALHALHRLIDAGEDEFGLFAYLANHARTLYTIKFYSEKNRPIPSSQGIHPFVIKKASGLARPFPLERFKQLMFAFFEEDFKIKIGLSKPKESLISILFRR